MSDEAEKILEASAESAPIPETSVVPESVSVSEPAPAIEPPPISEPILVSAPSAPEPAPISEPPTAAPLSVPPLPQPTTVVGSGSDSAPANPVPGLLAKARAALFSKKQKKLEKILKLASEKIKIRNDDVQKLLRVSDATATRYLTQLVKEGKIKRSGSPNNAFYEPIQ